MQAGVDVENMAVTWAVECSKRSFGKTGKQIRQLLDASGRMLFPNDNLPSIGWLQRFRARYPEVTFKKQRVLRRQGLGTAQRRVSGTGLSVIKKS